MLTSKQVKQKYLEFFKQRGHVIIPSASILPDNDPSVLFTGSGMQPMVPYLLGEKHPQGVKIADSQKCFRSQDIEEIGDNRHTTMFQMLGNWSLGDYFKGEQIPWIFEFVTKELKLDPKRLYVTVFRGNDKLNIPRDDESVELWKQEFAKVKITAKDIDLAEKNGLQDGRIFYYDETKNWWSRSGTPEQMPVGEPGGPDSEMFWDFGEKLGFHEASEFRDLPCHVNCDCGRFLEIGNNVFMEYQKTKSGFEPLPQKNVDFGGGLERMTAAVNDNPDIFMIDAFVPIIKHIGKLADIKFGFEGDIAFDSLYRPGFELDKKLEQQPEKVKFIYSARVIADHLRAATFILGDEKGIPPSNLEAGYVLRRLIRRAIRHAKIIGITKSFTSEIAEIVIDQYKDEFPELEENKKFITTEFKQEEEKFSMTLTKGLTEFEKLAKDNIDGKDAFILFSTYGFPLEMTQELANERGLNVDEEKFKQEFKKHQELSRTATAGKFKGGLADHSVETTRLHTAHHLLLAALQKTLGQHVAQKGSNITAKRLRIDFSHPDKMTPEQIKTVEDLVNQKIQEDLIVEFEEMTLEQAKQSNATGVFEHKYAEKVKVYKIFDPETNQVFSLEICGGPHVKKTSELGQFKLIKEEASSAGIRRIKAVLQ